MEREQSSIADWFVLDTMWRSGYPQPRSEHNGYLKVSMDVSSECARCALGGKQVAPFRMSKPPSWGARGFVCLHWVEHEMFCRTDIWEAVFRPFGVDALPVLSSNGAKVLDGVVQLLVPADADLNLDGCANSSCPQCGEPHYDGLLKNPAKAPKGFEYPALKKAPELEVGFSAQVFGYFGTLYRPLIVSRQVYEKIAPFELKKLFAFPLTKSSIDLNTTGLVSPGSIREDWTGWSKLA